MAVNLPTIEELENQILNYKATEFGVSVDDLGNTIRVESKVEAGLLYQFYLTLGRVEENIYPDICDTANLLRYGQGLLNRLPAPATQGEYEIQVNGSIGATIPSGTTFKGNDDSNAPNFLFVVDATFTLSSTTDTLTVRALTSGLESKLNDGNFITSTQPLANVNDEAEVVTTTLNPTEAESIESYREDVLQALRLEPQGGSPSDYRLWVLDVPEVRTVYPYTKVNNVGSIDLYVEATPENSELIIGVPSQEILDDVYKQPSGGDDESGAVVFNESEQRGRKPTGIFSIQTLPVIPLPVDLEFTDLSNIAAKDDIQTAVENYLSNIRPYVAGAESLLNKNDLLTIGQLISIVVSVLDNTGGTFSDLNMKVDSTLVNSFTFTFGFIPYLRNIINNGLPI